MKRIIIADDYFNEKHYNLDRYLYKVNSREYLIYGMNIWVKGIYFRSGDNFILNDDEKYYRHHFNNMPEPFKKR